MSNKRIGIITIDDYENLGNRLQNYAVQSILNDYGNVETIDSNLHYVHSKSLLHYFKYIGKLKVKKLFHYHYVKSPYEKNRQNNFKEFNKNIKFGYKIGRLKSKTINKKYDYFAIGSDQIWNLDFCANTYISFAKFADKTKNIAVSPSIGKSKLNSEHETIIKESLKNINYLSCREQQGSDIITSLAGRECTTLIDPTLMLSSDEWDKVSKKPVFHNENDKYILLYFLGEMTKEYKDIINNISKRYNLKVIDIYDKNSKYYTCGPSEFIYMIKHCSIMLTDSFHGSVFSYIYNKPFRIFKRIDSIQSMNSRLENLINVLHLSNDIYINIDTFDIEHVLDEPNYDKTILENEQKKFKDYLDKAFKENSND
jgi:hypothetical protein